MSAYMNGDRQSILATEFQSAYHQEQATLGGVVARKKSTPSTTCRDRPPLNSRLIRLRFQPGHLREMGQLHRAYSPNTATLGRRDDDRHLLQGLTRRD